MNKFKMWVLAALVSNSAYVYSAYLPWPFYMGDAARTGLFTPTLGERGTMDSVIVKWSVGVNTSSACPVFGDIDDDDSVEIVVGGTDSTVYALKGLNGTTKWRSNKLSGSIYNSAGALGDIDGNTNTTEVVIGTHNGVVFALDGNGGAIKWSRKVGIEIASSPVLGNIDANAGTIEVVVNLKDTTVCLNGVDGSEKWKVKTGLCWNEGGVNEPCSPAIADLEANGDVEVILASNEGNVKALNGNGGSLKWSCVTEAISGDTGSFYPSLVSAVAVKDINNDGIKEISTHHGSRIYLINGGNGTVKWSQMTGSSMGTAVNSGVAMGDVDSDNKSEVVFRNGGLYALDDSTGNMLWSYDFPTSGLVMPSPVLGDLDGDSKLEVVGANHEGWVACLEGETGALKWEIHITTGDIHPTHGIGDVDGDGCLEIVGASLYGPVYVLEADCPQAIEESEIQTGDKFKVLNNRNKISVLFGISKENNVSISVFDVSGREKEYISVGRQSAGSYEIELNTDKLESNVYFIKLNIGGQYQTRKIVVVK